MANLQLPFGIKVLGQQALDAKYLNDGVPYVSIAEANTILSSGVRSIGLTVNINFVDFHYKDDITDEGLVIKTVDISTKENLSNKQDNLDFDGTGLKYTTVGAVRTHTDDIANPHNVTKAQVGLSNASDTSDADKPVSTANQEALDLKLNTSDYNDRFKGVYLTLASLNSTHPTGVAGEYAQVNESGATEVLNYNWDVEKADWVANAVQGFSANNTDELPEGSNNLYSTLARFVERLTLSRIVNALGFTPANVDTTYTRTVADDTFLPVGGGTLLGNTFIGQFCIFIGSLANGIRFSDSTNDNLNFSISDNGDTFTRGTAAIAAGTAANHAVNKSQLDLKAPLQAINDTATASVSNVGKTRYYVSGNASFVDMVMQTGASTYAWTNIVSNTW
jgi:hypothetical protein